MEKKLKGYIHWLRKAIICLAFLGFLVAKDARAYGLPPIILAQPLGITVQNGDNVTFNWVVGVSLTPLTPTWYLDGAVLKSPSVETNINLLGIVTYTLTIKNASQSRGGNYSMKVENNGGAATSGQTLLTVLNGAVSTLTNATFDLSQCAMTNGGFRLKFVKPANSNCVVDASTDFVNWTPIYTNASGTTNISFLDSGATNRVFRYYRTRLQ